jgi:hypothetical protein
MISGSPSLEIGIAKIERVDGHGHFQIDLRIFRLRWIVEPVPDRRAVHPVKIRLRFGLTPPNELGKVTRAGNERGQRDA